MSNLFYFSSCNFVFSALSGAAWVNSVGDPCPDIGRGLSWISEDFWNSSESILVDVNSIFCSNLGNELYFEDSGALSPSLAKSSHPLMSSSSLGIPPSLVMEDSAISLCCQSEFNAEISKGFGSPSAARCAILSRRGGMGEEAVAEVMDSYPTGSRFSILSSPINSQSCVTSPTFSHSAPLLSMPVSVESLASGEEG